MPFYHQPHPWNPGYAIPKYVLAEPPGRGTFTTKWLPRRTISQLVPDYLAKPGRKLLGRDDAALGCASVGCGVLGGDSLGADDVLPYPGGRLEVGPHGSMYETLGDLDVKNIAIVGAAAAAAWLLFLRKPKRRRNPARRRRRRRR